MGGAENFPDGDDVEDVRLILSIFIFFFYKKKSCVQ